MELKRLLLNKIEKITKKIPDPIDENHSIAMRIMCPEYSLEVQDVKTFPITTEHPVYILFWNCLLYTSPAQRYPQQYGTQKSCTQESDDDYICKKGQ